jgi:hypothetical protein
MYNFQIPFSLAGAFLSFPAAAFFGAILIKLSPYQSY